MNELEKELANVKRLNAVLAKDVSLSRKNAAGAVKALQDCGAELRDANKAKNAALKENEVLGVRLYRAKAKVDFYRAMAGVCLAASIIMGLRIFGVSYL